MQFLLPAGLAILGLGFAASLAGVVIPLLFRPGVWVTTAGLLVCVAAGLVRLHPRWSASDAD